MWKRASSRVALLGISLLVALAVASVTAPTKAMFPALRAPDFRHWFGTDAYGFDVLQRLCQGAAVSVAIGCVAALLAVVVGTFLGALAGFYRGNAERIIVRLMDVLLSFPIILVLLAFRGLSGSMSATLVVVVFASLSWADVARLVRAEVLRSGHGDFVLAAEALGFSAPRILWLHVLPQAAAPSLIAFPLFIATAIAIEATLSFVGVGLPLEYASWGALLAQAIVHRHAWWLALFPGLVLFVCVASFSLLADVLRDATNPKLRFYQNEATAALQREILSVDVLPPRDDPSAQESNTGQE